MLQTVEKGEIFRASTKCKYCTLGKGSSTSSQVKGAKSGDDAAESFNHEGDQPNNASVQRICRVGMQVSAFSRRLGQ